jgi:CheY-like chemotaxis protein
VEEARASGSRLRRKILIVEDTDDIRDLFVLHFRSAGYEVESATEGNAAIAAALRMRPHVIVLDLAMPDMDGADTLATLRSYPTTMETPVIVCTGYPGLLRTRELTYSAIVAKPCTALDVEQAVLEALGDAAPDSAAG